MECLPATFLGTWHTDNLHGPASKWFTLQIDPVQQ